MFVHISWHIFIACIPSEVTNYVLRITFAIVAKYRRHSWHYIVHEKFAESGEPERAHASRTGPHSWPHAPQLLIACVNVMFDATESTWMFVYS